MALHTLTAREVEAAREGSHADGGGLFLLVKASGSSWVFKFTSPSGRRREMGLGVAQRDSRAAAGESLTLARTAAARARSLLAEGKDPIDERQAQREAARAAEQAERAARTAEHWTLCRCARDYHERVIEPSRTTKHAADWIASLEHHVPRELWHARIDAIEPPALLSALLDVRPHERARRVNGDTIPETVGRIRQRLDAVCEDAIFHRRATTNPAAAIRRKMREASGRRVRGSLRALPYGEAPALMAELRRAEGSAARCLEFAGLTAARTSEALLAEWREFDLDAATWTVPGARMKGGEPHTVALSPRAVELLKGQQGQHERWVFVSPMPDAEGNLRPLSNGAMLTLLDRLGVRDRTTVHGLCRSTFSTWANERGISRPDVIEACLAHEESNRVRAAYNRAQFADERRELMLAWSDYLARPAAPVLRMPERAA